MAIALVASCSLGEVTVAKTTPVIVVHSVLNPSATNQVVLVERTLSGKGDGVLREHESVFAIVSNQPYLARPDSFVYTIVLANMFSPFDMKY